MKMLIWTQENQDNEDIMTFYDIMNCTLPYYATNVIQLFGLQKTLDCCVMNKTKELYQIPVLCANKFSGIRLISSKLHK